MRSLQALGEPLELGPDPTSGSPVVTHEQRIDSFELAHTPDDGCTPHISWTPARDAR